MIKSINAIYDICEEHFSSDEIDTLIEQLEILSGKKYKEEESYTAEDAYADYRNNSINDINN